LIAGLILTVLCAAPARRTDAQTAGMMSSLISRMQRSSQNLKTLRANINMWKYNSQLREEESYSGVVRYVPVQRGDAFVYLEWTKPQHEFLVSANGNYSLYRPRLGIVYEGKTNSMRNRSDSDVLSLLSMSSAQLRARFGEFQDMTKETLGGGVATTHFKATPKGPANYRHIEVWIDEEGMPVQTKMVEKNDDATTIRLTNLEKNQTIPSSDFKLSLPANVKHVKG
jgi:outer membrane lipoprotein-sorting protein